MTRKDLKNHFGTCVTLTAEHWASAVLLGGARQQTNTGRAATSDRGRSGNDQVDLHGALGELLLFEIVRSLPDSDDAVAYMRHQLFRASGGREVEGPDLLFREDGRDIGVDVKTFDCAKNKKYFAINDNKHVQLRGKCAAYMGLVCPSWARTVCVLHPIQYRDVSTWERQALRGGGSYSRNLPLEVAMEQYGVAGYSIEDSRQQLHDQAEIQKLARKTGDGSPVAQLSRLLPDAANDLVKAQAALAV